MKKVRTIRIPVHKLPVGEPVPFTILDDAQRVLLHAGGVMNEPFLRQLKEGGHQYIVAEIIEEEQALVASLDVPPEIKDIALERLEETLTQLFLGKAVSMEPILDSVREITRETLLHNELIVPLSQLKRHDDYTYAHSLNVTVMALLLGKYLGLGEDELTTLGLSSMFHDLGKLSIPLNILGKPGTLTNQELQAMKQHPLSAKNILDEKTDLSEEVKQVVFQHHEKINGSGYPLGLTVRGINPLTAIVSVADIFEALISQRPYRQAVPAPEALEYLMGNAGYTLDERVVTTFIRHLSPYRTGEMVLLSSGERAQVITINHFIPFRPTVRIAERHSKSRPVLPREIDLSRVLSVTIIASCENRAELGTCV